MCQTCGCSPCKKCGRPIKEKLCSGCHKPSAECTCEPQKQFLKVHILQNFPLSDSSNTIGSPKKTVLSEFSAYENRAYIEKSFMNIIMSFSANSQSTKLVQPGQCSLNVAGTNAQSGFACYRRDGVQQGNKLRDIVPLFRSKFYRKWYSVDIGNYLVLRVRFASIGGIRACFDLPKTTRTEAESATAREKSIFLVSLNLFRRICLIFSFIRTELFSFPVHCYQTNNCSEFKFCQRV